ncbi:MAG: prepilin-type N-terminal cleavage/methylation domain-containing protein [Phycisphaerae bacterium]|nr:prepilin-type N-terminal cleavage/methylation domain-containing protein [Phycisphaerae bacterium]
MHANALGRRTRGFSLVELVIVIVIIGIIAAVAVPRMSRANVAASENSLRSNLRVLRSAIDLFRAEHNDSLPALAKFTEQLTTYSDVEGGVSATKTGDYIFGPYLRALPTLPVGSRQGQSGVAAADAATIGWIYDATTGNIIANCKDSETDSRGVKFNTY